MSLQGMGSGAGRVAHMIRVSSSHAVFLDKARSLNEMVVNRHETGHVDRICRKNPGFVRWCVAAGVQSQQIHRHKHLLLVDAAYEHISSPVFRVCAEL